MPLESRPPAAKVYRIGAGQHHMSTVCVFACSVARDFAPSLFARAIKQPLLCKSRYEQAGHLAFMLR
jgi:hypothetical protein